MTRTEILTDVPTEEVNSLMDDFKTNGAIDVSKKEQSNGKWTVVAVFQEKEWEK